MTLSKTCRLRLFICVIIAVIFKPFTGIAQVKSISASPLVIKEIEYWNYHSKIINEDYTLYVHFPPGYDTTKKNYPVLYMTDGDWNMTVAMNCFNMLRQDYETIEPLIVGIGYGTEKNKRDRDLNPATGGPNFLAFIEKEVIPFVKEKYRVNDNKALYGYSYGGMFTTFTLFSRPNLFNMIFIGAPGNQGNDLLPSAKKYFIDHKELNCRIFAGVGSYETMNVENINNFKAYLLKQNCKGLDIETAVTPNAGHGAALAQVMQNAIAFAYCKTHKAITLPFKSLERYTGNYVLADNKQSKFKIYIADNALYFKEGDNKPILFTPYSKNGFFMYENQKADISFNEEKGKMYMLFGFANEKPSRLNRVD